MSVLNATSLTLGFSGPNILDGVELTIQPGERVCLVGRNGEGKSSLMKVLAKKIEPDSGTVDYGEHTHVAYLTQHVPDDVTGTIQDVVSLGFGNTAALLERYDLLSSALSEHAEEELKELEGIQRQLDDSDGWNMATRVSSLLSQLDLDADVEFQALSGGMKRRVLLAQAVAAKPGLLMLDEPTNHLDIESISWLETFLKGFPGSLLFVTHDRMFLRNVATRILDLDRGNLTSWPGNFDLYQERKADALHSESKEWDRFDKKLAEEEVWIRQGIKARRTRNEGRVRALEKLRKERKARRDRVGHATIKVQSAERSGRNVIEVSDLTYGWDDTLLVDNFSCTIQRGDRIGLLGPNGAGKTTLVRLLLGELTPKSGLVDHGTNLEVAYFDQLRAQLDENATVQDNLCEGHDTILVGGESRHVIGYLRDFLFSPERARSPVRTLSGGERNRLLLAKLFTQPANVLVLDEPTNDLDTETLELLETLLIQFDGTLLLVSHDREFLNNVVTSTIAFDEDGGVRTYVGGYDDWVRQRPPTQAMLEAAAGPEKKAKAERANKDKPKKLSFKEKKELEALPAEIEALEQEQGDIHEKLAEPDFYKQEGAQAMADLNKRLEEIETSLSHRYERWEALEAIAEES